MIFTWRWKQHRQKGDCSKIGSIEIYKIQRVLLSQVVFTFDQYCMICDPIGIKSWYRSIRTKVFCETLSLIISHSTKITLCRSKNPTKIILGECKNGSQKGCYQCENFMTVYIFFVSQTWLIFFLKEFLSQHEIILQLTIILFLQSYN